jgi:hypothetical protein
MVLHSDGPNLSKSCVCYCVCSYTSFLQPPLQLSFSLGPKKLNPRTPNLLSVPHSITCIEEASFPWRF